MNLKENRHDRRANDALKRLRTKARKRLERVTAPRLFASTFEGTRSAAYRAFNRGAITRKQAALLGCTWSK